MGFVLRIFCAGALFMHGILDRRDSLWSTIEIVVAIVVVLSIAREASN